MFDYAMSHLLGRATSDAVFVHQDDRIVKASFSMACNIPITRNNEVVTKTVFRRIMVLGSYAKYVYDCQNDDQDGLKGRLINVVGVMDDEKFLDDNQNKQYREVTRVAPGGGFVKIMDRRMQYED